MVIDMGYWTKVLKRIVILLFSIFGFYLLIKLSIFYMPFVIAFLIAMMIEPIIKFVYKRTRLNRKTSAILVLIVVSAILIGLIAWGIITLVSEAYDLLGGINDYTEKVYNKFQEVIDKFDFDRINLPEQITGVLQGSFQDVLRKCFKINK